jgi:hypothetical protein
MACAVRTEVEGLGRSPRKNERYERLLTELQRRDDLAVPVHVGPLEIVEKLATLTNEHEKAAARVVILLVDLEMIREVLDALTQERNLNFGRTRIGLVETMLGDDGGLGAGGLRHGK